MHRETKFHRAADGAINISTGAADERQFMEEASGLLRDLIGKDIISPEETRQFMSLIADIAAKYRGYKSPVREVRLLIAGEASPAESSVIASTEAAVAIEN